MRAGIALGSNLGNRHAFLSKALVDLKNIHEDGEFLVSTFVETTPQDCTPDSPDFLNAVVELKTSLTPLELLDKLRSLELGSGRESDHGFHTPRTLDLDLLYCDGLLLDHPDLQLPHPRIRERYFVLKPLAEIRPDLILPGWPKSCKYYLSQIHKI